MAKAKPATSVVPPDRTQEASTTSEPGATSASKATRKAVSKSKSTSKVAHPVETSASEKREATGDKKPKSGTKSKSPKSTDKTATAKPQLRSSTELKAKALRIVEGLARTYPIALCALNHSDAFQLLVATILSAQCTDERVNMVTPALFAKYPTPKALADSKQDDVEELIRSTGFFRAKATNIRGMADALVKQFGGQVPQKLEQLIELPGTGRKTANVVLGTCFGIASGVVVDTHVKRITYLLGLTASTNPEKIEQEMIRLLPSSEWVNFSHRLIHHGRQICIARRPQCERCPLLPDCDRTGLEPLDGLPAKT